MAKKNDKFGIGKLMVAATDLSNFAVATVTSAPKWSSDITVIDKYNWLLHVMYARGEYERMINFIRIQTYKNTYMTYVEGLVHRQQGRINEALDYFQNCARDEPSLIHIKQVAKSLVLLGRYRPAIDAYKQALTLTTNDWEILHTLGLCYLNLNELNEAKKFFLQALQVSEFQEASYLALGKLFVLAGDKNEAETVYERGARRNPESPELFTQIGLLAFEVFCCFFFNFKINFSLSLSLSLTESQLYKSIRMFRYSSHILSYAYSCDYGSLSSYSKAWRC